MQGCMQGAPQDQGLPSQQLGGQFFQGAGGTANPYGGPMVHAGPPNQAAKVIGILLMVYGGFSILSGLASALGGGYLNEWLTDIGGAGSEEYLTPTWVYVVQGVLGSLTGAAYMYSGWLIQEYKKKGIWFAWGVLAVAWVLGIVVTALTPMPNTPEMDSETMRLVSIGSAGVCGLFGAAFCGLILAIPLFITNNGMD